MGESDFLHGNGCNYEENLEAQRKKKMILE